MEELAAGCRRGSRSASARPRPGNRRNRTAVISAAGAVAAPSGTVISVAGTVAASSGTVISVARAVAASSGTVISVARALLEPPPPKLPLLLPPVSG